MKNLLFVLLCLGFSAYADGFADHNNIIGSGVRSVIGYGPSVNYSRRFTNQLYLGASFAMFWDNRSSSGGSLDTAQYYRDEYSLQMSMVDLNATFFLRENGYAKWGPLLRAGLGHAHTKARGWWGRYDRDPAWIIIGDDKRLLESREDVKEWDSTFVRAGAYYQFVWNFHEGARVGHVLEAGLGAAYFDARRTISYTRADGAYFSRDVRNLNPVVEINYYLAF